MSAKDEIKKKVEEVYGVSGANVYHGTDYTGAFQTVGWWYCPFGETPFYLGKFKATALETLDQVATERAETRP